MNCFRNTKRVLRFAPLLTTTLFFTILTFAPSAQAASRRTVPGGYDGTQEVTLNGTIQAVISQRTSGRPVGLHLLVASPQGVVDAHLGPYLTKDTEEALRSGQPVQVVGAMEKIRSRNYLLVRQLIFAGRMVTVRSERGFLLRAQPLARPKTAKTTTQVELTGGAL
jgi:hypothetical protein